MTETTNLVKKVSKPYDVLTRYKIEYRNLQPYDVFFLAEAYEHLNENCPVYLKLPKGKHVVLGQPTTYTFHDETKCLKLIPR